MGAVPANAQANVGFVDNIDEGTRTNGTAVLKIAFSDGSTGVLTVGCHGPGAPPGIFEGIATTKGFKTYSKVPRRQCQASTPAARSSTCGNRKG